MNSRIKSWVDWFVTADDPLQRQRGQVVVVSAFMLVLTALIFLLLWMILPANFGSSLNQLSVFIGVAIVGGASAPFVLRKTGSLALTAGLLATLTMGVVAVAAYFNGGFRGLALAWLTVIPLFVTFVVSPRAGVATALVVMGLEGVFAVLTVTDFPFFEAVDRQRRVVHDAIAAMTAVGFVAVFGALYETSRDAALAAQTRLERENRELAEINRIKSQFLALISHELRTPLNAVIGYSRIVRKTSADALEPLQLANLQKIQASGEHLLQIVNDLLDVESVEAGGVTIEHREVDVTQLVADLAQMHEYAVHDAEMELCFQLPDTSVFVETDPVRLRQILDNLVSNALKYGDKFVEIGVREDLTHVVIWVRDHGPGIAAEDQKIIFAPFRQLENSLARSAGGVGLGLHLVARLAEQLGAEIDITSELGEGAHFELRLPRP